MNKFELINTVLTSHLAPENKTLLIELIMRSDDTGLSWPSVERLCKARGIKHEKNFKGADVYLEGLVRKIKKGRRNHYRLNVPAIEALGTRAAHIKHTPALEGVKTLAVADNTPALADDTPSAEGANSSRNNTLDSSEDSSTGRYATLASSNVSVSKTDDKHEVAENVTSSSQQDTPATTGALETFVW